MKKLFVHIPKNAGMTIRQSSLLKDRILPISKNRHISKEYTRQLEQTMKLSSDGNGYEHARYRDINLELRAKYKAFAVVRNPWERVVSRYYFAKKIIEKEQKQPTSYADTSSFEAFLEERHIWGNKDFYWHRAVRGWFPAKDHVIDEKGIVRCDIIRFEHLNEEIEKYFGMDHMTRAYNVTFRDDPKPSYQDIYTDKTIQIVADWYKADIEYWGFEFGKPATRNYWGEK